MFDLHGNDRLTAWKQFRNSLETSSSPFENVSVLWSKAPFVNQYLDRHDPKSWPDPWHLIIDGKFDDLAICLGMLYTLKLTQRFTSSLYEIHMSMPSDDTHTRFFLVVDHLKVLNFAYREVVDYTAVASVKTSLIYKDLILQ